MIYGLDIVSVGIEHEGRIVAWMVLSLAGRTVVATAGGECRLMEAMYRFPICRLEGEVKPFGRRLTDAHKEFISYEPAVARAEKRDSERVEDGLIETPACREIPDAQVNMID